MEDIGIVENHSRLFPEKYRGPNFCPACRGTRFNFIDFEMDDGLEWAFFECNICSNVVGMLTSWCRKETD